MDDSSEALMEKTVTVQVDKQRTFALAEKIVNLVSEEVDRGEVDETEALAGLVLATKASWLVCSSLEDLIQTIREIGNAE